MTSRKNKNKQPKEQKSLANTRPSQNENEYDVSSNFKKVRQYTRQHTPSKSSTEVLNEGYYRGRSVRSIDDISGQMTGVPTWDRYDRLEDKISDFNEKNEVAHSNLRRELEDKIVSSFNKNSEDIKEVRNRIDSKLSKQWYTWTITGLVAIVTLFWTFSYSKIVSFVDSAEKRLMELEYRHKNTITTETPQTDSIQVKAASVPAK